MLPRKGLARHSVRPKKRVVSGFMRRALTGRAAQLAPLAGRGRSGRQTSPHPNASSGAKCDDPASPTFATVGTPPTPRRHDGCVDTTAAVRRFRGPRRLKDEAAVFPPSSAINGGSTQEPRRGPPAMTSYAGLVSQVLLGPARGPNTPLVSVAYPPGLLSHHNDNRRRGRSTASV